jgi:hypothetical protein
MFDDLDAIEARRLKEESDYKMQEAERLRSQVPFLFLFLYYLFKEKLKNGSLFLSLSSATVRCV